MNNRYGYKDLKENMARALGRDLDISTKISIEISNWLRGRTTEESKKLLQRVLEKKQAVPFKRFMDGVGHRAGAGIVSGRFPEKASKQFLALINAVEANAQAKGLASDLMIVHLAAQKGTNQYHGGRQRRREFKRTHLEIVVEEMDAPKKDEKKKAVEKSKSQNKKEEVKSETPKKEVVEKKPAAKPSVKKPEVEDKKEKAEKKETPAAEKKVEVKEEPAKKEVKEKQVEEEKKEHPKKEEKKPVEKKEVSEKKKETEEKKPEVHKEKTEKSPVEEKKND